MTSPIVTGGTSLGGTIGARVAAHLQRAVAQTRVQLGPYQAQVAQKILTDFTNHVSDEVRSVMGPLWQSIADSPQVTGWARDLAHRLGNETGQAWAWIGGTATGAALGSGLITLLTNELQPIIGPLIAANPNFPLSPSDAAMAANRGLRPWKLLADDAAQAGIDNNRFVVLQELARSVLSAQDIQALYASARITHGEAISYAVRAGWDESHMERMLELARTRISLQDGASMANRSIVDMDELREIARLNGYDPDDAARYAELAGEPLPVQDLLTALRRGIIGEDRARRGWIQGPTRNEWFDVALNLQYSPMSTVDAADAVNQGHMTLEQGQTVAEWNGLMPDHFRTLIENAGLPPGVELATEAWNRGLLTEAQFEAAFLESRLKNRYVPLYKALRYRVMPQETVRRLYREGALSYDQAVERLGWAGFSPEDSRALLSIEDVDATAAERDLTKSEILSLYVDRAIDSSMAVEWLEALGYSADAVNWQIALADLRRERKYVDAVLARVRAGYVAGRLDLSDASTLMDSLRIPPDQREEVITLWDLERSAQTRGLTAAQVQAAFRRGLLSAEDALSELSGQGYSDRDASILLRLAAPATR